MRPRGATIPASTPPHVFPLGGGVPWLRPFVRPAKLGGGGIFLTQMMGAVHAEERSVVDRTVVLTDEQDCDIKLNPKDANAFGVSNYLINIASEKYGIGYEKFIHVDGFSERVVDYIQAYERDPFVRGLDKH
jgi:hypothetical protein